MSKLLKNGQFIQNHWLDSSSADLPAVDSIYPSYLKILSCERSCGRIAALQSLDGVNDPSTFCALHCIPQSSLANPEPSGTMGIEALEVKGQKHLVPLNIWLLDVDKSRQLALRGELGVSLNPDDDPSKLTPQDFAVLAVISVSFPRFTDGRGYSTATLLRRAGYRGELRAVGDILVDQLHFLRRVGFDAFALRDDQSQADAVRLLTVFSQAYQTSSDTAQPIYRRVQRA